MRVLLVAMAAVGMLTLAACGSSDKPKTAKLTVTETQPAKGKYAYTGLKPIPAGPVQIDFTNDAKGKAQHEVQLIRVDGNHSRADVLKIVSQDSGPIPPWLHAAGGVGAVKSGASGQTTEVLPPGKYYALDTQSEGMGNGPSFAKQGAIASFEVTGKEKTADLPSSTANVTVKDKGGDKFQFETSGLKAGENTVEFVNDSKKEIHHIQAFPLLPGKTTADVKKVLLSNGPPKGKPPIDFESGVGTSVIDQKTKEVTGLNLPKPGKYMLVCFLTDRDGKGKPHFADGMLKEVDVK